MSECIFCKIVDGLIPSRKVYETDYILAFYDIHPKAKFHVLIIPKKHIASFSDLQETDADWLGHYMYAIKQTADILKLPHYKLQVHNGAGSGQEVFHLHTHLLSPGA